MRTLTIVTPVFNDWDSFRALVRDLNAVAAENDYRLSIVAADDGSIEPAPANLYELGPLPHVDVILKVQLAVNLGHQRALAVGLCVALEETASERFILMDADGEDRPQDIATLIDASERSPVSVVVAQRRRRSEKLTFRLFYKAYKAAFVLLTGREISFGNFSLLSREHAIRISMVSDLWNNLPASLMRSRLPIKLVPIDRGHRYSGSSKMGFVQLSLHGMSAYSVYTDAILVRLLIATFAVGLLGLLVTVTVTVLRLFSSHTTPGWATTVVFGTATIVTLAMFTTLTTALLLLNARSQRQILPAVDGPRYVRARVRLPFLQSGEETDTARQTAAAFDRSTNVCSHD